MPNADTTPTVTLTQKQEQQLADWIDQARELESSALKYVETLWKIKDSGFWTSRSKSWPTFLRDELGISQPTAYRYNELFEFTIERRRLAETNPAIEVPSSLKQARKMKAEEKLSPGSNAEKVKTVKVEVMSAKLDPAGPPIEMRKPPANPIDLQHLMDSISKHLDHLIHRSDIPFEAFQEIRKCACELNQARQLLQGVLPGMEETVSKPKFRKPSLDEIQLFCHKSGIVPRDGEWFWNKMEGCGWKNGGKPVVDWGRTLIAWKLAGHLPSQKAINGAPVKPKSIALQEFEKVKREVGL